LTTRLRLLLDECFEGPLATEVAKYRALNVEYVNETILANCGTQDDALVRYATKQRRILVTPEGRLNEHKYKICTHPGIIVLKATKRHGAHAGMLRDLVRSGLRTRCRHAVTYLKLDNNENTVAIFKQLGHFEMIRETSVTLIKAKGVR
jgi:Domain of unknown function (DUF5615)